MADTRNQPIWEELSALRAKVREYEATGLQGSGGGGTSGGMEERVRRLEASVDSLKDRVADLRVEITGLKVKVEHLPTKGFIVASAITTIGGISALLVLLQKLGILT